jgi:hypothetical protein
MWPIFSGYLNMNVNDLLYQYYVGNCARYGMVFVIHARGFNSSNFSSVDFLHLWQFLRIRA